MTWEALATQIVLGTQVLVFVYFLGLTIGYLALDLSAFRFLSSYLAERRLDPPPRSRLGLDPPISILVPAYNEERTIATSVESLLQLHYDQFEVIVINDGSTDRTLDVLRSRFALTPFPEPIRIQLETQPIRQVYRSQRFPSLYVIDKDNGGKSDALNAGLNVSHYPLCCSIDADSILQPDSLIRVVQPFLEDPTTIAVGGTCRPANGCTVRNGLISHVNLPRHPLALIQIVEYLRAFFFGRLGWLSTNAILIISGAFGLFKKQALLKIRGYRLDTVGEDMDLIVHLHAHYRLAGLPYRIAFLPDPICWTDTPEDLATLRQQRIRWQRGLGESLMDHLSLLFNPKAGAVGWLAFPFYFFFEWLGPIVEILGYAVLLLAALLGLLSWHTWMIFTGFAIACGLLLSTTAILLEEWSFRSYRRPIHFPLLLLAAVLEQFGYRQLVTWWRFLGVLQWFRGNPATWGTMRRRSPLSRLSSRPHSPS